MEIRGLVFIEDTNHPGECTVYDSKDKRVGCVSVNSNEIRAYYPNRSGMLIYHKVSNEPMTPSMIHEYCYIIAGLIQEAITNSITENHSSNTFVKEVLSHSMIDPLDILNWYRNLYYKEGSHTEQGIMAMAINNLFMKYKDVLN